MRASATAKLAEQTNICWRATQWVDSYCNQPLRADVVQEEETGPNFRLTVPPSGSSSAEWLLSRWPITRVYGGRYAPTSAFPPTWTDLTETKFQLVHPVDTLTSTYPDASGDGPMLLRIAPGIITWWYGRGAWRVQVAYLNGWAHTSLSENAEAGATELHVDTVTGWVIPTQSITGQVYDGGMTETATVSGVVALTPITVFGTQVETGPGTLTLKTPLLETHAKGTLFTTLPWNVIWASIEVCVAQALTRGAEAVVAPGMPGSMTSSKGTVTALYKDAKSILDVYKRIL